MWTKGTLDKQTNDTRPELKNVNNSITKFEVGVKQRKIILKIKLFQNIRGVLELWEKQVQF